MCCHCGHASHFAHMHRFANAGLEAGLGWAGLGWAGLGRAGLGRAGPGWAGLGWAGQGINRGAKDRMRTVAISAPHLRSAASSAFASSSVLPRISASVCANQSSCHICTETPSRASSARLRRIGTQSSQTCAKKLDRRIGCCDRQQRIEQNGNVLNQPVTAEPVSRQRSLTDRLDVSDAQQQCTIGSDRIGG